MAKINLFNLVKSSELESKVSVHGIIAGCGGPNWNAACERLDRTAKLLDNENIKFALVEDDNLLRIYVSECDKEKSLKILGN